MIVHVRPSSTLATGLSPYPTTATQSANGEHVSQAIHHGANYLMQMQQGDGHWCGELEGDTILESEFVLLQAILGRWADARIGRCARYLLEKQEADGGWNNYPGGPTCLSTTVKAYFALKIAGYKAHGQPLKKARARILELGGAEGVNSFTRYYLAALKQIPYSHCPSVPPEIALLPSWFPLNIYKMSSWTRSIVVPLSLVQVYKPITEIPSQMHIGELFKTPPSVGQLPPASQYQGRIISWENFFRFVDRCIKSAESFLPFNSRQAGIEASKKWLLDHCEHSDGVGAIFPPMVYTVLALKCLGYSEQSPEFKWAEEKLEELVIDDGRTIRIQPCFSPVWDTAISTIALGESVKQLQNAQSTEDANAFQPLDDDGPELPSIAKIQQSVDQASEWLLDREIRRPGDWSLSNPQVEPTGWAFEYKNDYYPDIDDTAMVLMALKHSNLFDEDRCQQTVYRALKFFIAMQ